ncbi:hypothetical protein GCM10009559_75360 [Pseudonocardia zijingensis]|uniref:Uncharacterized protein n=1 Tax=Pseudonocardia zijingensis TaxID=153376 RepID=A0ABN1NGF2_9PSEU
MAARPEPAHAFELERQQRDEVAGDDAGPGAVGRPGDEQPGAQAAGTERVHLAAVGGGGVDGGAEQPLGADAGEQVGELPREGLVAGAGARDGPFEEVDDEGGPARGALVRGEDAREPAGLDGGRGERALGVQRPLELPAFLARPPREHRLRDGDERHPVRHGEQRQARLLCGPHEARWGRLVAQVGAEPEAERAHARGAQARYVGRAARVGFVEQQPDREQELPALQPRARFGELGDGGGLDLAPELVGAGGDGEPQRRVGDEVGHGQHERSCTTRRSGVI